ncbi:MAG: zinc ribbon domain-containing protein [Gaiellaceae bacterium]
MTDPTIGRSRTCPECAEEVRAAARVCRFCGHSFDQESPEHDRGRDSTPRQSTPPGGWRPVPERMDTGMRQTARPAHTA